MANNPDLHGSIRLDGFGIPAALVDGVLDILEAALGLNLLGTGGGGGGVSSQLAGLVVNSAGAATANTTILRAAATALAAGNMPSVIFPDGEVWYNGQIPWIAPPPGSSAVATGAQPESTWPIFDSQGTTTFRYSGAAAPSENGIVGMASMTFKSAGTYATARLRLKNLKYQNAGGVQLNSTTVGTAITTDGVTSVTLAGGTVAVGDAIAIDANSVASITYSPPWWATVTAVAGNVVTFANQPTCNNFRASVGNRVLIYKQTRAIQVGGIISTIEDVGYYVDMENVTFIDWFSAGAMNDVTYFNVKQPVFTRCIFGFEHGYNVDSTQYFQPETNVQKNSRNGTVTAGSRNITGLSVNTADLYVGMTFQDTAVLTPAFPEQAVIETIVDGTTVTMSHPSATTGSKTFTPMMCTMMAQGEGTSPFYPLQTLGGTTKHGLRSDGDLVRIIGGTYAECRAIYHTNSGSNSGVVVEDYYPELCQRVALIGNQQFPNSAGPYIFRRAKIQSPDIFAGPAIETLAGAGCSVVIEDVASPNVAYNFPYFKSRTLFGLSLNWNRVNAIMASGVPKIWQDSTIPYGRCGLNPGAGDNCIFSGGNQDSGLSYDFGTLTGVDGRALELQGMDKIIFNMGGSFNWFDPGYIAPAKGKLTTFIISCPANVAYTLTMSGSYVKADGVTAIPAITSPNTAGVKVLIMQFRTDGQGGIGRQVLQGFQTPAFV